jgi:uncharacterized metal-binding protein
MASGVVHENVSFAVSGIAAVATAGVVLVVNPDPMWFYVGVMFWMLVISATLFFSPDLDGRYSKSRARWERFGLGWYWNWYAKIIPHRSVYSHSPIGSLLKFLYIAPFWLPLFYITSFTLDGSLLFGMLLVLYLFCALLVSDLIHIVVDFLS